MRGIVVAVAVALALTGGVAGASGDADSGGDADTERWLRDMRAGDLSADDRAAAFAAILRHFPAGFMPAGEKCGTGTVRARSRVFEMLVELGPEAEPLLAQLLRDPRPGVRVNATYVLSDALEPERRLALLAMALGDVEPRVREQAAASVEMGCAVGGLEVLRPHLADADPLVRRRVATAMASWGDIRCVPALIGTLGVVHDRDEIYDDEVRWLDGPLEVLANLTRRPLDLEAIDENPDGSVADRDEWARWWDSHRDRVNPRAEILRLLEAPMPQWWLLTPRLVARLDDPAILAALRAQPEWHAELGEAVFEERAKLLADERILVDPLADRTHWAYGEALRRILADEERTGAVVAAVLASGDLDAIANLGIATIGDPLAGDWREPLLNAARARGSWTWDAIDLLGVHGTREDCAELAAILDPDLATSRDRAMKKLACHQPVPP